MNFLIAGKNNLHKMLDTPVWLFPLSAEFTLRPGVSLSRGAFSLTF